ncbi:hypothetical protein GCM10010124_09090 [Pilimelia terevasa]|uniref:Imm-5-like domain-containing protein n=1 Tax=Pilimelia terevasa TaxID=53372 RepID=A0A8J3FGV4_9ACTN|nr:exonuclease SbcC [Pilimelia terevasa]GGK18661.1 hypothetical protein GCM10010124_09090 [Pilimelia terevasa]
MTSPPGDFALSMEELRVVARYAAECAQPVLPVFEAVHPDDPRPRTAIDAAWTFVGGAPRAKLQRDAALAAHRAARDAGTPAARAAARAAGDAAAAAYLHPLARATQGGHILRAAAFAARAAELAADGRPEVGQDVIAQARRRATPTLIEVLRRYPPAPEGRSRVDQLWKALDTALRSGGGVTSPAASGRTRSPGRPTT